MTSLRPLLALALALASAGCAGTDHDPRVGAADVQPVARVVGDLAPDATSMRVAVDIAGLAAPGDLAPDARAFVAWVRPGNGRGWERLGSLDYDPATRAATLPGVTVDATSFELIVTAEVEGAPATPSAWVLFAQAVKA